jgi:hypothetical protein
MISQREKQKKEQKKYTGGSQNLLRIAYLIIMRTKENKWKPTEVDENRWNRGGGG